MAEIKTRIGNNLRQIAAAADQFYLENGLGRTKLDDLVGPGKYIRFLKPIDGEDYRQLELAVGRELKVTSASGIVVTYAP